MTDPDIADPATAAKLEEAYQSGTLQGGYRPIGIDLVSVKGATTKHERLPPAVHGHGDNVTSIWIAPDGVLFAAGFMYTGKPGPDTGAIYRRGPGGKIVRVVERPEHEMTSVWGSSSSDVYAIGKDIFIHWDGTAWSSVSFTGGTGKPVQGYTSSAGTWVAAVSGDATRIYRRGPDRWISETSVPCWIRSFTGAAGEVWAGGDCPHVYHRNENATWSAEPLPASDDTPHVYGLAALTPRDVYAVTGTQLVHTTRKGWTAIPLPSERVWDLAATGNTVYALGTTGVFASPSWKSIGFDGSRCNALAATPDGTLYCAFELREPL